MAKIYLGGRIEKNGWRHNIVDGLREACTEYKGKEQWGILPKSIFGVHDYTGAFFIGCDHGCSHGENLHGYGSGCSGLDLEDREELSLNRKQKVIRLCYTAISRSDVAVFWLDRDYTDAHGSMIEIGFAVGQRIPVWIMIHPAVSQTIINDLWFAVRSADKFITTPDPKSGLKKLLGIKE
jgi:hypothetical protein